MISWVGIHGGEKYRCSWINTSGLCNWVIEDDVRVPCLKGDVFVARGVRCNVGRWFQGLREKRNGRTLFPNVGLLKGILHGHGTRLLGFGVRAVLPQALACREECVASRTGMHAERHDAGVALRRLRTRSF
jgi:hypothetical protein